MAWAALGAQAAEARSETLSLLRDTEIEDTLRLYATPLFEAARLQPDAIGIHIVQDDSINAFVALGRHLFIHTACCWRATIPGLTIGTIAHETGHIAGGHLPRLPRALENASALAVLSTLTGVAVGVFGRADAGLAVITAGQGIALRNRTAHSRLEEYAADQAALTYLDAAGQSARGLRDLFVILERDDRAGFGPSDPYLRTHPLAHERVDIVQRHMDISPWSDAPLSAELVERHRRMLGKLRGFLEAPRTTYRRYPESDPSVEARYARSVAKHREGLLEDALDLIDGLIAQEPANGFFRN